MLVNTIRFILFLLYFSLIESYGHGHHSWQPNFSNNRHSEVNSQQKMQLFYQWKQIEYAGLLDYDGMYLL